MRFEYVTLRLTTALDVLTDAASASHIYLLMQESTKLTASDSHWTFDQYTLEDSNRLAQEARAGGHLLPHIIYYSRGYCSCRCGNG